jgi:hypothetical protein
MGNWICTTFHREHYKFVAGFVNVKEEHECLKCGRYWYLKCGTK